MTVEPLYHLMEDPMLRALRLCSLLVVVLLVLGACGSGSSGNASSTEPDASGTTTMDITFKGNTVTPQGASVKVKAGKPLKLHIVADKPGELHVHSSPEQQIAYKAGTTDATLTLDKPGIVEMESHNLDKLVAQLEVR
ncbi:MAG: hypothetical protein JWQ67_646 [Marmoricola sp.]|nr:hypothetical protein [Marmoricola sp.]